jgi:glycosyltransferase A (GT-A) superfamily protein (DUF2064 family)
VTGTVLLVAAKAPVPGRVKTRLTPPARPEQAAEIAAASLLDTLDTACATPAALTVLAWDGGLNRAVRGPELAAALTKVTVIGQRGGGLAVRLAAAHTDVGRGWPGRPVFQIGMDTPQVDIDLLTRGFEPLHRPGGPDAVLGPASDGGWWALGVREPHHAQALVEVPMSQADTAERTLRALQERGLRVGLLPELSDVDTFADARWVAALVPGSRFAAAVAAVTTGTTGLR